jgi:YVTN family beta-propeller protein
METSGGNVAGLDAYVANDSSDSVSVVDTATNSVLGTIPVGDSPVDVVVNVAGTYAYVSNESSGTVSVISTAANSVVSTINVGTQPNVITAAGNDVFVSFGGSSDPEVMVIDATTNLEVGSVPASEYLNGLATNEAGTLAYDTDGGNSVSVLDVATGEVVATIPTGAGASSLVSNPQGTRLYVVNTQSGTVSVINTSSNTVSATIAVGSDPSGVAINPSGTAVYIENTVSGVGPAVSVINTSSNTVVTNISVPEITSPAQLQANPSGSALYALDESDSSVSVIDTSTNTLQTSIQVGAVPDAIAFNFPAVSYTLSSAGTASDCSVFGSLLTAQSAGTCVVTALMAGDANYSSVSSSPTTITFTPATQSPLSISEGTETNGVVSLATSGGSVGGDVEYVVESGTNSVSVINTSTAALVATIPVGDDPQAIVLNSAATVAYVANEGSNTISVIDTATNSVTSMISGLPNEGEPDALSLSGTSLFVTSTGSNSYVAQISTETDAVDSAYGSSTPFVANGVAYDPLNFSGVYVANPETDIVSQYHTGPLEAPFPEQVGNGPDAVAINPQETDVYVANGGSNSVSIFNARSLQHVATIPVGDAPSTIAMNPVDAFVYVGNSGDGTISVIDASTQSVSATIPLPSGYVSDDMAVNPQGTLLYVSDTSNDTETVISTVTDSVLAILDLPSGSAPTGIAISQVPLSYSVVNGSATDCQLDDDGGLIGGLWGVSASTSGTCVVTATVAGDAWYNAQSSSVDVTVTPATTSNQSPLTITSLSGSLGTPLSLTTQGGSVANQELYIAQAGNDSVSMWNTSTLGLENVTEYSITTMEFDSVTFNQSGTVAYVAGSFQGDILPVDVATDNAGSVFTGENAGGPAVATAINPAGTELYVAYASGQVDAIDLSTQGTTTINLPAGSNPLDIVLNPSGTYLYVADAGLNDVFVISTASDTVVDTIPVGTAPDSLSLNSSGTVLYVANDFSDTVSVVNTETGVVTATVPVGNAPFSVAVSPLGNDVLVANYVDDTVSVINTSTKAVSTIDLPLNAGPYDVAFNSTGSRAYVANSDNGTVSIINTSSWTVISTLTLTPGSEPEALAVNEPAVSYSVTAGGTASGCSVQGVLLTASTPGTCLVTATMAGDQSDAPITSSVATVTFSDSTPGQPAIVSGTDADTAIALSWSAPSSNGGEAISGYSVTAVNITDGGATQTDACPSSTTSTSLSCTVENLVNGDEYTFEVAAINSLGTGEFSYASQSLTPGTGGGGGSGGGGGGGSGGGSGGGGATPPSGSTPPPGGGGSGGTPSPGVKPTVVAVAGSLHIGGSDDLVLSGSGFEAGAKVASNAKGVKFKIRALGAGRIVLTVLTTASVRSGTYRLTIMNRDGRGDTVLMVLVVNKQKGVVVVHLKP